MKKKKTNKKVKIDKFDLFVLIMSAFSFGMLVQKIAIYGISCLTTIYR